MVALILLFFFPAVIILIDFIAFLKNGKRFIAEPWISIAEIGSLVLLPWLYAGIGNTNYCCGDEIDTPAFSKSHQLSIVVVIICFLMAYAFSKFRENIEAPVVEVLINLSLMAGLALNIVMLFHVKEMIYMIPGVLPIIFLAIMMLVKNHKLFVQQFNEELNQHSTSQARNFALRVLTAEPLIKYPLLLILSFPFLFIIASILIVFGQKPDSFISAFTETYKHGLSEWDYKCANVGCGGHYLCSVAAKGHRSIVKPVRYGVRNGGLIICNRQLLISNAFEDKIQELFPRLHKHIRKNYDKVGDVIYRNYRIFENKIISDVVYILMKPLEWFFLLFLYVTDKQPENRIAIQYLRIDDKKLLKEGRDRGLQIAESR